jgi:hypothetical protein
VSGPVGGGIRGLRRRSRKLRCNRCRKAVEVCGTAVRRTEERELHRSAGAAAAGPAVQIADAVRVCLASGLILLVLRQVMPMAAGLSHGFALHSFGAVSRTLGWGLEQGADMLSRGRRAATRASVR